MPQNLAIRSDAPEGHLWTTLQSIQKSHSVKLMGAQMSWYEVFIPIWVYCGRSSWEDAATAPSSTYDPSHDHPAPEGATDNSWMTPEDRVKAQAAQEASAAGTAACCSFVCVFVVAILVAVKAQDYSSFHAIIIFIPLSCVVPLSLHVPLHLHARELPEEEPG